MDRTGPAVLLELIRGEVVESIHRGHIAVVDAAGFSHAHAGNSRFVTFPRSCIKFHQAIPLVVSGAFDRFGLSEDELAISCSSHHGEEMHIALVRSILSKIGLGPDHLLCGAHPPQSASAHAELIRRGEAPGPLHNNCSGKHAGMLALALHLGASLNDYTEPKHLVQSAIRQCVAEFAGVDAGAIPIGIDGCSVPTFALPLDRMALMFARLARPDVVVGGRYEEAVERIWSAVAKHPALISNTGELDPEIIRRSEGAILSKGGAEAMLCLSLQPSGRFPAGLGIAIKIEDGTGSRCRAPIALHVLRALHILEEIPGIAALENLEIRNHANLLVGRLHPVVSLQN